MFVVPLIERKRDGGALSAAEWRALVQGLTDGSIPDYQLSALLMAVLFRGLAPEELTALTLAMRDSGEQLAFPDLAADVDMDLLQLARHLGADVDVVARLQGAGGGDDVLDVAALHADELVAGELVARSAEPRPQQPAAPAEEGGSGKDQQRACPVSAEAGGQRVGHVVRSGGRFVPPTRAGQANAKETAAQG